MALSAPAQQILANALNPFGSAIPSNGPLGEIINVLGGIFSGNIQVGTANSLLSSNNVFSFVGGTLTLGGQVADGASAVAVVIKATNALANAGAKILSIQNSFNVEKAFVGPDGTIELTTVGAGVILKSPDGTRYKIVVANGGALSTTPA